MNCGAPTELSDNKFAYKDDHVLIKLLRIVIKPLINTSLLNLMQQIVGQSIGIQ